MARADYKDLKFMDFAGGLATRVENNLIADNQSPDLLNIIFDGKGSIVPRMGNVIFGATTSSVGQIRSTWTTNDIHGNEIVIRNPQTTTTSWLEYYNPQTLAWENLDAGYTQGQDFGHCSYDYFTYYSNPVDYQRRWLGVCWQTSTYADSAYSRIDLRTSACSALGFLSAGSVVIGGEEVYYSSYSGTALSGITFTTSHAVSSGVAQLPTSAGETPVSGYPYFDSEWASNASALAHGSIMLNKENQLYIAGISGSEQNYVYRSVAESPTSYTVSAVPNYGGYEVYPQNVGGITALADFEKMLLVMKQDVIRRLEKKSVSDGNGGLSEIIEKGNIIVAPMTGCFAPKSIAQVENDIIMCSPNGWIKQITANSDGIKVAEASLNIRPTVEGLNMTSSSGIYFGGKYYLACATAAASVNDTVMVYDYEYKAWTKFNSWNVRDWFIYGNKLYYGASNEIATYKALTNYDDNGSGYTTYWASKWFDYGVPNEQKALRQIYMEGYMTTNSKVGVSCYFDGDTSTPTKKSIEGTGDYITTADSVDILGETVWGRGTLGNTPGTTTYTLNKFKVNLQYPNKPFYNMQIKIGTGSAGFVYKITHIAPYVKAYDGKRVPTAQII
jgi:hypothetical protein